MPQQHIQSGPLQNKASTATFGDGSGLRALGQGLSGIASLGANIHQKEQEALGKRRLADDHALKVLSENTFVKGLRDGEQLTEEFDNYSKVVIEEVRGSPEYSAYLERYNEDPPWIAELESRADLWQDSKVRGKEAAESLSLTDSAYNALDDQLLQTFVDENWEETQKVLKKAQETLELAPTSSRRELGQTRTNELFIAAAKRAPTLQEAADLLKETTLDLKKTNPVLKEVEKRIALEDRADPLETDAYLNEAADNARTQGLSAEERRDVDDLISSLPPAQQITERRKMGKAEADRAMNIFLKAVPFDDEPEESWKAFTGLEDGEFWKGRNTRHLTEEDRKEIRDRWDIGYGKIQKAKDFEEGFMPFAELIDERPALKEISDMIKAVELEGDTVMAQQLYKQYQRTALLFYDDAGIDRSMAIPVSAKHVNEFKKTITNPSVSVPDKEEAFRKFITRAGDYAIPALADLSRNNKDMSGVLGTYFGLSLGMLEGDVRRDEFTNDWIQAQTPVFTGAYTGPDARFPSLKSAVATRLAENYSINDMMAGVAQANRLDDDAAAGFTNAMTNYVMKRALRESGGLRPEERHIETAVRDTQRMFDSLNVTVSYQGSLVNFNTKPVIEAYRGDIGEMNRDIVMFFDTAVDPSSQDSNFINRSLNFDAPFLSKQGFLTQIGGPLHIGAWYAQAGVEALLDSSAVQTLFPGRFGGIDANIPVSFGDPEDAANSINRAVGLGGRIDPGEAPETKRFSDDIEKIDFGKLDFLSLHPALKEDPYFSDINEENREQLQRAYFKTYGGFQKSSDGKFLVPILRSSTGNADPVIISGNKDYTYNIPIDDLYLWLGAWKTARDNASIWRRVIGGKEDKTMKLTAPNADPVIIRGNNP